MSIEEEITVTCPNCRITQRYFIWRSVNISVDPELRDWLLEGKINFFVCKDCDFTGYMPIDLMYHDMQRRICIQYYPFDKLQDEKFFHGFSPEGFYEVDSIRNVPNADYIRKAHVVFSMDELVRYMLFREMLYEYHNA